MQQTKRQYAAIDIAKYVSALLVVAIHVYPFVEISETFNTFFIAVICRLAVPFFFACSGYFFFKGTDSSLKGSRNKLFHYLKRIGILYLVWTVIYLPYTLWNYASEGFSIKFLFSYIRDFFLNGSYYHLWFLPALMLGMWIVWRLMKSKGLACTLQVALGLYFIGYLINVYAPVWESLPFISLVYGFFTKTIVTARDGIFFAPIFLALGALLARTKRIPNRTAGIGFLVCLVLLALEVTLYYFLGILQDLSCMFLMLVPAIWFLMSWLLTLKVPWKPAYKTMREDSTLIYVSHILFARILLLMLPNAHLVVYLGTLACAQLFSSCVVYLKDRWHWLQYLM